MEKRIGLFIHAEATAELSGQNQAPWPSVNLFLQVLQSSKLPFFDSNQSSEGYLQSNTQG